VLGVPKTPVPPSLPGVSWSGGPNYAYDAGQPWAARKHRGSASTPQFEGRFDICKCPNFFTQQTAEAVLNDGQTLRVRRTSTPAPEADWVFAVVDGWLYRGVPTGNRGTVFHAFPECRKKFGQLPAWVRKEVDQWVKQHRYARNVEKLLEQTP
jgi:hypothetical protein